MKTGSILNKRGIFASIIGNVIEWYDFALFLSLAPIISSNFFPKTNKLSALLLTFLVFAMGFLLRPIGSIIFGHLGDRIGRAKTLKLTIFLMAISAIGIAISPSYQTAGVYAPIILTLLRMLQGLCISGEFAGSMIYLTESAPDKKRAFISCMTNNGSNLGIALATACSALLAMLMSKMLFNTYGWRILFMLGGLIGLFGLWLRSDIQESEVFKKIRAKTIDKAPLLTVFRDQKRLVFNIFLLLIMSAAGTYVLMGYLTTYLHVYMNYTLEKALQLQAMLNIFILFLTTFFSVICDKYGRKATLYFAALGYVVLSIPCFYFLKTSGLWYWLLPMVIIYASEQASTPVTIVEMYPGSARYSGVSIGYNLSMVIIGGTAPLVNTWLINTFHNTLMIAYYLIACALISLTVIMFKLPLYFGEALALD